jgi:hypothetical protein
MQRCSNVTSSLARLTPHITRHDRQCAAARWRYPARRIALGEAAVLWLQQALAQADPERGSIMG